MPIISIIINCHNSEEYLGETLDSVKAQSFNDYEIILLDNASTDHTKEIALKYDSRLKYFYSQDFISLGAARNKALELCSGDYIAFLDSDDLWEKDKLATQVSILKSRLDIGLVMTNCNDLNMFSGKLYRAKNKQDREYCFDSFIMNYAFVLSSFMVRKTLIEALNMWFDERFQYAEEYDFFSRLMYRSKAYYIGRPLAVRRMHGEMSTVKLASRIPLEHQMTLENLRSYIPNFDKQYPEVAHNIEYLRDYMDAKYRFPFASNKEIRCLVKPYILKKKKAFAYFLIACLPKKASLAVFRIIYHNSI